MLALRCRVFILERAPTSTRTASTASAWHLLGRDEAGALRAYLRIVDPGLKYAEPSIGRVVPRPRARGSGLADGLVAEGLARAEAWPGAASASARRRTCSASTAARLPADRRATTSRTTSRTSKM